MSWEKVRLGMYLKVRDTRFKPSDSAISDLRRIDKIDFSGEIFLSDKPSNTDMILVKKGDLVISGINVEKGAMAVYSGDNDITATIHYSAYSYDENKIDIDFLKSFLKSLEFKNALKEQVPGGIKTEIKPKHLLPLLVTLPTNINDQRAVVRLLQEHNSKIETVSSELTYQLSLVKKLRQQILQDAVQGKLVAQNPNDEPASELLKKIKATKAKLISEKKLKKEKELPAIKPEEIPFEIPEGWVWCRLGEISKVKIGSTPSRHDPSFWGGDIPWVSSGEVANNFIYDSKEKITKSGLDNTSLIVYPKDSVLVAMIGQGKTRGQTSILKIDATTNQNVAGLIIEHKYLLSEFLWFFFLSRYEITRGGASGGNQPALNGIKISNTLFPFPPLPEQLRIVQKLNALMQTSHELETSIQQSVLLNEKLLQQVLREALQGGE